jgi:hypothetical protein
LEELHWLILTWAIKKLRSLRLVNIAPLSEENKVEYLDPNAESGYGARVKAMACRAAPGIRRQ